MSDYVMKLQHAMKQQNQDLRDELEDLKNWQSQIKDKSAAVTKKHDNHKNSDVFNAAAGSNIPPIRYTAAAATAAATASTSAKPAAADSKKIADLVTECKDRGNAYFQRQQFDDAARAYTQGLDADPTSPLCSTLYANRALCNVKLQKWDQAEKDATSSINLNRTNGKAFYRRALARKQLGRLTDAKADLDTVQVLVPGDADSAKELVVVNKMIVEKAKNENKGDDNGGKTTPSASASPKRKKLVIEEVSDDEDEDDKKGGKSDVQQQQKQVETEANNEDSEAVCPKEQKKRDDKVRADLEAAEARQVAERRRQAAAEEAARNRQRRTNTRVEVVDEDEDVEEPAPKIQVQAQKQHHDPTNNNGSASTRSSASPQPANQHNNKPTAAATTTTTTTTSSAPSKSASPSGTASVHARKLNVQVFTADNMPNPENFADFERIYREVSKDLSLMAALAEKLTSSRSDAAQVAQLFGSNLTNEMLSSLLNVAAEKMTDGALVGQLLKGLSQVKRLDDLVMFMESSDKKFVKAAIDKSNLSASEKSQVEKKLS